MSLQVAAVYGVYSNIGELIDVYSLRSYAL